MTCMQVCASQLKASPSSRLQGASLGTDFSTADGAAGLRQSRKSTGSSDTCADTQCHTRAAHAAKASPSSSHAHGRPSNERSVHVVDMQKFNLPLSPPTSSGCGAAELSTASACRSLSAYWSLTNGVSPNCSCSPASLIVASRGGRRCGQLRIGSAAVKTWGLRPSRRCKLRSRQPQRQRRQARWPTWTRFWPSSRPSRG